MISPLESGIVRHPILRGGMTMTGFDYKSNNSRSKKKPTSKGVSPWCSRLTIRNPQISAPMARILGFTSTTNSSSRIRPWYPFSASTSSGRGPGNFTVFSVNPFIQSIFHHIIHQLTFSVIRINQGGKKLLLYNSFSIHGVTFTHKGKPTRFHLCPHTQ